MVTEVVGTILLLVVFMIAFTYFLSTLFFRRIEKKDQADAKKNKDSKIH